MATALSPKRRKLEIIRRPEGGPGGTRPVVVPPGSEANPKRDLAGTLSELVDALIGLTEVDRAPSDTPKSNLPLLLNAIEAGRLLSISRAKVLDLAARGRIPSIRVGRSVRIPRDRLIAWIDEHAARNDEVATFIGQTTGHRSRRA